MRRVTVLAAIASFAACAVPAVAQYSSNGYGNRPAGAEGFYREKRDRTVYYQYERNRYCGVQNEAQMNMLGSFKDVRIVDRLRLNGRNTGGCSWPNGFYRRDNGAAVYLLEGYGNGQDGGRICEIATPQQLRQLGGNKRVKVVPGNSNLEAGRSRVRPC
ncbi:hypothetical protein [Novosphingobium sp. ZW T3_23]|uniref:hypothetical protein n=1 Tax=Novosphingobium sp. ZW T3_23 TaxID=3378084 RepID=UPI003852103D